MSTPNWAPVVGPTIALIGALAGVGATIWYNAWTNRANLFSNIRVKWFDLFREQLGELLILGERLYEPLLKPQTSEEEREIRRGLSASVQRLVVLLGRENPLLKGFGVKVREFAKAPSSQLADELEGGAQEIFRFRWDQLHGDMSRPRWLRGRRSRS